MSRGFAIFTLVMQVLGHAVNMSIRHDSSLFWFLVHLGTGTTAIWTLAKNDVRRST